MKKIPFRLHQSSPEEREEVNKMEVQQHLDQVVQSPFGGRILDNQRAVVTRANGGGRFQLTVQVVPISKSPKTLEHETQARDYLERVSSYVKASPPNGKLELELCDEHKLHVAKVTKLTSYA